MASITYAYLFEWFPFCTFGMIGGFGVSCFISAPDWPFFNCNPVGWHRAIDPDKEEAYFKKLEKKKKKKDYKQEQKNKNKSPSNKEKNKEKKKDKKKNKKDN